MRSLSITDKSINNLQLILLNVKVYVLIATKASFQQTRRNQTPKMTRALQTGGPSLERQETQHHNRLHCFLNFLAAGVWMQRLKTNLTGHTIHPETQSQQDQNLEITKSCRVTLMTILPVVTCVMNYEIKRVNRLSQAPVHLVTDEQVCSLTIECQVYEFVPRTSISRQSVSILVTFLQLIQVPLS